VIPTGEHICKCVRDNAAQTDRHLHSVPTQERVCKCVRDTRVHGIGTNCLELCSATRQSHDDCMEESDVAPRCFGETRLETRSHRQAVAACQHETFSESDKPWRRSSKKLQAPYACKSTVSKLTKTTAEPMELHSVSQQIDFEQLFPNDKRTAHCLQEEGTPGKKN